MSKRSFRVALIVVLASFAVASGGALYVVKRAMSYPTERRAGSGSDVELTIAPGMSFPRIASLLADKGVLSRPRWFRLYAMHRGVTTKVKVGTYKMTDNMTPEEVLDRLLAGVQDKTALVTIPEGL